mmetsp:Transcript_79994/g.205803  ORF Transcript_79994/g.205803 Transcript_79994/m.205803 type:complete len:215 (+) Transcript_79994:1152-1796(+)
MPICAIVGAPLVGVHAAPLLLLCRPIAWRRCVTIVLRSSRRCHLRQGRGRGGLAAHASLLAAGHLLGFRPAVLPVAGAGRAIKVDGTWLQGGRCLRAADELELATPLLLRLRPFLVCSLAIHVAIEGLAGTSEPSRSAAVFLLVGGPANPPIREAGDAVVGVFRPLEHLVLPAILLLVLRPLGLPILNILTAVVRHRHVTADSLVVAAPLLLVL